MCICMYRFWIIIVLWLRSLTGFFSSSFFRVPLYLPSSWCYIYLSHFFVIFFTLPFQHVLGMCADSSHRENPPEPGWIGLWPGWLTIVLQRYDSVGWVIWRVKLFPTWPVMCQLDVKPYYLLPTLLVCCRAVWLCCMSFVLLGVIILSVWFRFHAWNFTAVISSLSRTSSVIVGRLLW